MLLVPSLRENRDNILAGLAKRNKDFSQQIDEIIRLDEVRRKTQNDLDNNLAEAN
jgi:seryl-tRNA synthetase